jgi:hypothetical protein
MASYMTTMFQIARSIFQNKPIPVVEPTEVKEVKDDKNISTPLEIIKVPDNIVTPQIEIVKEVVEVKDVKEVVEVVEVKDVKEVVEVKEVVDVKDVVEVKEVVDVKDVVEVKDVKEDSIVDDLKEPIAVSENTETVKPVDSAPKRKPRGKTKAKN